MPCPPVLKIFNLGATGINDGAFFTETTHSQGVTDRVEDEKIVENGLSKNLRVGCGFELCYTNFYITPIAKDDI
jgi:hypothetical protein